ncbi:MAG: hypothetical protein HPY53_01605 [Brevinematales bacterium]|nr:hypothetical protein [Brevinematales bacterium]
MEIVAVQGVHKSPSGRWTGENEKGNKNAEKGIEKSHSAPYRPFEAILKECFEKNPR